MIEYIPQDISRVVFYTRRNQHNSWTKKASTYGDAMKWHLRLGLPSPRALEYSVNCLTGAQIRGPMIVECDACGQSKTRRRVHRAQRNLHEGPGYRIAIDFHDYIPGIGGYCTSSMLVIDQWSGLCWDYYLSDRKASTIIAALEHLFGILKRHYEIEPRVAVISVPIVGGTVT